MAMPNGNLNLKSSRRKQFEDYLSSPIIDLNAIRKLTFIGGCLDDCSLRSVVWKLMFHYLPLQQAHWKEVLKKQRETYVEFVKEIIKEDNEGEASEPNMQDHPLNTSAKSKWRGFFKDNEALLQINKDCRRLYPDLDFFQRGVATRNDLIYRGKLLRARVERSMLEVKTVASDWKGVSLAQSERKSQMTQMFAELAHNQEVHWEVVERILFIYVKLNPGQGYVQGMNEIIGPLYYVFYQDTANQAHAEADTFWVLTGLMSEIRDNFIKYLDDSRSGIGYQMHHFLEVLKAVDPQLWQRLIDQDIKPQFFAFRWFSILLTQEFILPDTLRIWDSLFSDSKRFDFLTYVCCSMLVLRRDDILKGDFSSNVKLIQNYPASDVQSILSKAIELSTHT